MVPPGSLLFHMCHLKTKLKLFLLNKMLPISQLVSPQTVNTGAEPKRIVLIFNKTLAMWKDFLNKIDSNIFQPPGSGSNLFFKRSGSNQLEETGVELEVQMNWNLQNDQIRTENHKLLSQYSWWGGFSGS